MSSGCTGRADQRNTDDSRPFSADLGAVNQVGAGVEVEIADCTYSSGVNRSTGAVQHCIAANSGRALGPTSTSQANKALRSGHASDPYRACGTRCSCSTGCPNGPIK